MHRKALCFLPLLFGPYGQRARAQKPAPQQVVTVTVVDVHTDRPQPVQAIIVSLGSLDGVSYGNSSTTGRGEAFLHVSSDTAQRDDLRIQIKTDANPAARDLVIFEAADGQVHGLAQTLPIKLLPKGSTALSGPAQIEAVQRRLSQRVSTLQSQLQRQQKEINGMEAQADAQKHALDAGLGDWAKANGLDVQVAQKKVLEWARMLQAQPDVSAERRALAAFALKNYGEAADFFGEATDAEMASLDQLKKQQQEQNRLVLQKILETTEQRANALQLTGRYHEATAVLTKTRDYLAVQRKVSPAYGGLRSLWLNAVARTASARWTESETSPVREIAGLRAQCLADYRTMHQEYQSALGIDTFAADPHAWADTQLNLALALYGEALFSARDKAPILFEQAVDAYRNSLKVYTRADFPRDWARIQGNLGIALLDQGLDSNGDKQGALVGQAVQAYRSALEVETKSDDPQGWARTQNGFAHALGAAGLFDEAIQAYHAALQVSMESGVPQEWAATQIGLGGALFDESGRAGRSEKAGFLHQAIQAYRSALEVYTQSTFPQNWAYTQRLLAYAFESAALLPDAVDVAGLLNQAVQAHRSSLEVYTKAELPKNWAVTQLNLGVTLLEEAERGKGDNVATLLDEAAQAFLKAQDIYTLADDPRGWAGANRGLGSVYQLQGKLGAAREARAAADSVDHP